MFLRSLTHLVIPSWSCLISTTKCIQPVAMQSFHTRQRCLWPWHKTELSSLLLPFCPWLSFQKKAAHAPKDGHEFLSSASFCCLFPRGLGLLQANMKIVFYKTRTQTHNSLQSARFPLPCVPTGTRTGNCTAWQLSRWMLGHRTAMLNCKICPRPSTWKKTIGRHGCLSHIMHISYIII